MDEKQLIEYIDKIEGTDKKTEDAARKRMNSLAKPPGSLGKLEDISVRYAAVTGYVTNYIRKKAVVIMCADNGITEEGVSATPQSVTLTQTVNFTRRLTGAGALARAADTDLCVIDVGIRGNVPKELYTDEMGRFADDMIIDRKIRRGTYNFMKRPAMSREEAVQAISTGIEAASMLKARGYSIAGAGEMGIGNTTTSAAVLAVLTGCPAETAVGRGAGLTDEAYEKKKAVINHVRKKEYKDVIQVLAEVGGFDICAMTGLFLGCAGEKLPVVVDGFISAVAALAACRLKPEVSQYLFGSHISEEPGFIRAAEEIGIDPVLDLSMRLGEGSGCILAFDIIKGALGVMQYMATYEEARIEEGYEDIARELRFS